MEALVYTTVFLALWHFFYEGVLAPALRHGLRYKFFELRDSLRNLDDLNSHDTDIKNHLDHSICNIVNSMSFLNLAHYFTIRKIIHNDSKLKNKLDEVRSDITNAQSQELRDIFNQITVKGFKALLINHGGWLPYLIMPAFLIILLFIFANQVSKLKNTILKVIFRLINTSERFEDTPDYNLI